MILKWFFGLVLFASVASNAEAGCIDAVFLEPKLSNFLVGEDKTRLEEIETYDPDLEANAEEAELFRVAVNGMGPIDRLEQTAYEREQLAEGERLIRLRAEKRALEVKARGSAEDQGHTWKTHSYSAPKPCRPHT